MGRSQTMSIAAKGLWRSLSPHGDVSVAGAPFPAAKARWGASSLACPGQTWFGITLFQLGCISRRSMSSQGTSKARRTGTQGFQFGDYSLADQDREDSHHFSKALGCNSSKTDSSPGKWLT